MFVYSHAMRHADLFFLHACAFFMRHVVAFPFTPRVPIAPSPLPPTLALMFLPSPSPSRPRIPIVPSPSHCAHAFPSCPRPRVPSHPGPRILALALAFLPLPSCSCPRPHVPALALTFLPSPLCSHRHWLASDIIYLYIVMSVYRS